MGQIKKMMVMMISGIFITATVIAQTTPRWNNNQQNRVNSTIDSRYSGVDRNSIEWETNDEGNYVGTFRHNNRDMSATFDRDGNWVSQSETIGMNDAPANIRNNIAAQCGDHARIQRVTDNNNQTYYDVTMDTRRYNADGTPNEEYNNRRDRNNQMNNNNRRDNNRRNNNRRNNNRRNNNR